MRPRTLRARLVAASLGSILAALVLFGAAASAITAQQLRSSLDRALEQRARDVARLSVSAPAVLNAPGAVRSAGADTLSRATSTARLRRLASSEERS